MWRIPHIVLVCCLCQEAEPEKLIKQLGDDDYHVRERATSKLKKMGEKALPYLKEAIKSKDLEVRRRAGRVYEAYFNVMPTAYHYVPWIDMLPQDYPERNTVQSQYLKEAGRFSSYPEYWTYREATKNLLSRLHEPCERCQATGEVPEIGARRRAERKSSGITLTQQAKRLGIRPSLLSRMERGWQPYDLGNPRHGDGQHAERSSQ